MDLVGSTKSSDLSSSSSAKKRRILILMSSDRGGRGYHNSIFKGWLPGPIHHHDDLPTMDVAACWIKVCKS